MSALCAGFGVEVEEVVPVEGIWTALGRVWGGGCPGHSNSEEERLRGVPFRALWGAFDFRTRIKGGGRKRPPPGHKAPQGGAFPVFEEGAPFRHSRRFQVVGDFEKVSVPSRLRTF